MQQDQKFIAIIFSVPQSPNIVLPSVTVGNWFLTLLHIFSLKTVVNLFDYHICVLFIFKYLKFMKTHLLDLQQ